MTTRERILARIEACLKKHGIHATQFGIDVAKDGNLVGDLRQGRNPRANTLDKIEAYIARLDQEALEAGEPAQ